VKIARKLLGDLKDCRKLDVEESGVVADKDSIVPG
jgi:hypothetical protein